MATLVDSETRTRIDALDVELLQLAGGVRQQVAAAVDAVLQADDLATIQVGRSARLLVADALEMERQLLVAATNGAPSPEDLGHLHAILGVINELLQVSDGAAAMVHLLGQGACPPLAVAPSTAGRLRELEQAALLLLDLAVRAFHGGDRVLAADVVEMDDALAALADGLTIELLDARLDPCRFAAGLVLNQVCRRLERVAQHAIAIARHTTRPV